MKNIPRRYSPAVCVRPTNSVISGDTASKNSPDTMPHTIEALVSIFPASLASSNRPAPNALPTMILPAFPSPRQRQTTRFLEILAIPLAATASPPICPIITEYMVNPPPQISSFKSTGTVLFRNPFTGPRRICRGTPCSFFILITTYAALQTACTAVAATVASAAPRTPMPGIGNSPKIKTPLSTIFRITVLLLSTVLSFTAPQFFIIVIYTCATADKNQETPTILRYSPPMAASAGSFVKNPIILSANTKVPIQKVSAVTQEMRRTRYSTLAMPMKSPFP